VVFGSDKEALLVRQGFPVNIECTAIRDYVFPVMLENPVGAFLCPVWLRDMGGLHCLCG